MLPYPKGSGEETVSIEGKTMASCSLCGWSKWVPTLESADIVLAVHQAKHEMGTDEV